MFKRMTVRTKLGLLMVVAMALLAGTRGFGLIQLGSYLDRMNGYTLALDQAHQQLQALQALRIAEVGTGRSDAASQEAHEAKVRILRDELQRRRDAAQAMQARERSAMYATYATMLVLVFVVCGAIYWLLMKTVVRPLQGVARVAHTVAAGDLTTDIRVEARDEIGNVMQALRDMNGSLGALIGKIRSLSQSIGGSTGQIAATSENLTQHFTTQKDILQLTAASLRELAGEVTANADHARRARELAASARDVAIKGGSEVGAAVDTMSRISNSSQKIVDIVSIIDGITFQTNILALNAAVEAARAGEQGRGFAVVAAEVRSLARRSAGAAREIATLINESVHELRQGSVKVETAGATMTQIVKGARAVDEIMAQIASASAQHRQVIEQVRATVDRIDQTSRQQTLLAQAADAAESMRRQAQELIAAVSVFRLAGTAADGNVAPLPRLGRQALN